MARFKMPMPWPCGNEPTTPPSSSTSLMVFCIADDLIPGRIMDTPASKELTNPPIDNYLVGQ